MAVQPDDVNLVRRDALLGEELRNDVAALLPDLRFDVVERALFSRLGIADHGLKLLAQLRRIRMVAPASLPRRWPAAPAVSSPVVIGFW
jgi:hypothetical protein